MTCDPVLENMAKCARVFHQICLQIQNVVLQVLNLGFITGKTPNTFCLVFQRWITRYRFLNLRWYSVVLLVRNYDVMPVLMVHCYTPSLLDTATPSLFLNCLLYLEMPM